MDDETGESFVNREDAIPIVPVDQDDEAPTPTDASHSGRKRDAMKRSIPPAQRKDGSSSGLKEKPQETAGPTSASNSIQDRFFTTLLQRIVPSDDTPPQDPADRRSRRYVERPGFSIPLMSNNFRRFNARIGIAFVFQNRTIRLFTWRKPTQTLAFLAIYSFLCLNPYLLAVAPMAATIFFIMVPAFLARHPPPTSVFDPVVEKEIELYAYPLQGPPLAPARKIRPAPDLSKDFFRNMRDLQNSMEDFSRLHDSIVKSIAPLANFSNEAVSSGLFLALAAASCPLFIFAHTLPWRAIFLFGGWAAICSGHPSLKKSLHNSRAEKTIKNEGKNAESFVQRFVADDIVVSSSPEKREVEIFELQRRVSRSAFASYWSLPAGDFEEPEYEPVLFSSNPYTPLDPARISGARPKGAAFFEDVRAPRGWKWSESKWRLDLASQEWVGERCVSRVEVEIEGERWVWDIEYPDVNVGDGGTAESYEEWLQRGGSLRGTDKSPSNPKSKSRNGNVKGKEKLPSWEEGSVSRGRKGEWRRRRWVRLVERRVVEEGKAE